jgi:hypothetical protein
MDIELEHIEFVWATLTSTNQPDGYDYEAAVNLINKYIKAIGNTFDTYIADQE